MSAFDTSKFRAMGKGDPGQNKDIFAKSGGLLGKMKMNKQIDKMPLKPVQQEYIKQVMAKYQRYGKRGITREEFNQGMDEMARNTGDPIKRIDIERIKRHFERF